MTDLITMPENYDNIRAGIIELLKGCALRRRPKCQFDHDGDVLGNWAKNRSIRTSRGEEGRIRRRAHPAIGGRPLGFLRKRVWGRAILPK